MKLEKVSTILPSLLSVAYSEKVTNDPLLIIIAKFMHTDIMPAIA